MAYIEQKDIVVLHMVDDERRTRNRAVRVDTGLFDLVTESDFGDFFALCMRGTVERITRSTTFVWDEAGVGSALEIGTEGDVNDKVNLVFLNEDREKQVYPLYDLEQDCFIATTGSGARIVKPKADLEAAIEPAPEFYLNQIIDLVLNGTLLLGKGTALEYLEGYKVD